MSKEEAEKRLQTDEFRRALKEAGEKLSDADVVKLYKISSLYKMDGVFKEFLDVVMTFYSFTVVKRKRKTELTSVVLYLIDRIEHLKGEADAYFMD
jgi:hypothetical protein